MRDMETVLWASIEDYAALYEVAWELNTIHPELGLASSTRRAKGVADPPGQSGFHKKWGYAMKARCIENDPIKIPSLLDYGFSPPRPNSEPPYSLTIGQLYPIVGMIFWRKDFSLLTQNNWGSPCMAHAGFFEPFTGQIPSGWLFTLGPGARASDAELSTYPVSATWGYPEFISEDDYDERLYDGGATAQRIFDSHIDEAAAEDPMSVPATPLEIRARLRMAMRAEPRTHHQPHGHGPGGRPVQRPHRLLPVN